MTGHDLATQYLGSKQNGSQAGLTRVRTHPHDLHYNTAEEAEEVLNQLARALAPADADLQQLALALANNPESETGENGLTRAELELRRAEARYRALVEQIPAITFMAPLDGTLSELYVSPQIEQMLGFSAKEWLDNPILWYQQLHPEDQDRWQTEFARTLNAGEHFRSDYRFISRDGNVVWIHGEAKVVSDEAGRPLFLQGVAFDITERMQAEERLQQNNKQLALARDQALAANRAKSAFLANMSHELRTPLHAILGFTEMLQEDAQDCGQESFLPDLDKIANAAQHLVGLISNILDLSKIEAGKMELFLESFDLPGTIQEVISTALPLIEKNGNELELCCARDLGQIHADLTKVRQVLFNLLSNAAKFTEGGTITLEASRVSAGTGDLVRLRVIDTGIGIDAASMDKLFQSFSQVDDSTTRKYGGTGLGLAISARFCRMMGGTLSVRSKPGRGSEFTVDLPVVVVPLAEGAPTPDSFAPAESSPSAAAPANDRPMVLVIDDDPQVHQLLQSFLIQDGLGLVSAASGEEGLRLAREVRPAAITLDANLPDVDSWTLLTQLKTDPELAEIPVLVCAVEDETKRACALGAADFLTKPVDWGRLSTVLSKFRNGKRDAQVLIIDDDSLVRETLTRMVTNEGWSVTEAETGRSALNRIAENPPDLILLDLMMPEMDGFDLVRIIRKTQAGRNIPVVVVTAKDLTIEDHQRLKGSVQKVLQKGSFSHEELLQEIRAMVRPQLHQVARVANAPRVPAGSLPARPGVATALEASALLQLQQQLETIQAERDALQAQLEQRQQTVDDERLASQEDQDSAQDAASEREQLLLEEAELARHQLREQQQTVQLLQAEYQEVCEQVQTLQGLETEVLRLREERDALRSQSEQAARSAQARQEQSQRDWDERQRRAEQEIDALRRELRQPNKEIEEMRAMLMTALARPQEMSRPALDKEPGQEAQPAQRAPARARNRSETSRSSGSNSRRPRREDPQEPVSQRNAAGSASPRPLPFQSAPRPKVRPTIWSVVYLDEHGQSQAVSATAEEIRTWLQEYPEIAADLLVGRNRSGPFDLLTSYPEFRDLATPVQPQAAGVQAGMTLDGRPSPKTSSRTSPPTEKPRDRLAELVPTLLAVAMAVLTTVFVVGGILFVGAR